MKNEQKSEMHLNPLLLLLFFAEEGSYQFFAAVI